MAKVTRSVQYRFVDRQSAELGHLKLEQALREALKSKRNGDVIGAKARARIADLNQSGQLTLWNGLQGLEGSGVLAGELVLYKHGFDVPAIEESLEDEGNRFELIRFQTDGKSKPVEGAAYFAVIGDHVGLIQSNAVTGKWLERYFTWLLKDAANVIEGESVIALNARVEFDPKDVAKGGPAKSLTLHAASDPGPASAETPEPSREFKTKRKGKGGTVLEVLQLMGLDGDALARLKSDIPAGGSLEGDFLVFIKKGNRRSSVSVGTLNHVQRHIDDGEMNIIRKGSSIRDRMQTFSESVRVQETALGLDPNDAFERIVEVLHRWNKSGTIHLGPD